MDEASVWHRAVMRTSAIKADWGQTARPQSGEAGSISSLPPLPHATLLGGAALGVIDWIGSDSIKLESVARERIIFLPR